MPKLKSCADYFLLEVLGSWNLSSHIYAFLLILFGCFMFQAQAILDSVNMQEKRHLYFNSEDAGLPISLRGVVQHTTWSGVQCTVLPDSLVIEPLDVMVPLILFCCVPSAIFCLTCLKVVQKMKRCANTVWFSAVAYTAQGSILAVTRVLWRDVLVPCLVRAGPLPLGC